MSDTDPGQVAARAGDLDKASKHIAAALGGNAQPVDVGTLALAVAIVRGRRRRAQLATDTDAIAMAQAVLALSRALISVWTLDRTTAYAINEPDRHGERPPAGDAWLTPREIVEGTLPFLASPASPPAPAQTPDTGASNGT